MPRNPNKSDWSGGLPSCIASFSVIEDPRTGGNKLHHFGEVLFMAVSAMLCGMNGFSDIEDFCDLQIDWLRKWIKMPNGVPRAQTFSNIFAIRNLDLQQSEGWSYDQRIEKSNGRIVTRSVTVNHRLDWMDNGIRGKWRDLRSLIHVETHTTQLDSDEVRREVRYYLSSLDEPASAFQSYIRQHWSIENSCHWVLDTTFREDHNQTYIGHAAKNLGALRRIVLNLLKIDLTDTRSLPKKRRRAMLDLTYRNSLLSLA